MRTITLLIIHCSATVEGKDITAKDIDRWHRDRGWKGIGYHYVVRLDGTIEKGRNEEEIGAHCKGHNSHSIGICYVGGLDKNGKPKDTRTEEQKMALQDLVRFLKKRHRKAIVVSHHTFDPKKACPCFDAEKEFKSI